MQKEIKGYFLATAKAEAMIAMMNKIERRVVGGSKRVVETTGSCTMHSLDGIGYRRSEK